MKKIGILVGTIISIIITFIFAEIFSLYHFGDVPTLLTTIYLISIFSIFEYILQAGIYIACKKLKKDKLGSKKIIGLILLFIALIMILGFIVILNVDWLNWYQYSSPFYINVIIRSIEILLPAAIISISVWLLRKK